MGVYEVSGPLAVAKASDGKIHYYYHGSVLPPELPTVELDRLVATGLVRKVDGQQGTEAPAYLAGPATVGPVIGGRPVGDHPAGDQPGGTAGPEPVRPADSASVAAWREYAIARGDDPAEVEQLNRKQLAERHPE
ncbi:hypothetical protein [Pseudonocardia sp. NPDC049635]|uniref:hypothetical protein n=1 Tax=Pseudonocardia sp. NPDC049635 TaxID=3155506 RepID=UPI0033C9485F